MKASDFIAKYYGTSMKKWIITRSICVAVCIILIVAISIGTNLAYSYEGQLNAYLLKPIVDERAQEQAKAAATETAKKVETGGATLLQNKDDTLPLSKTDDKAVNVFGYGSVEWFYSGHGSNRIQPEDGNVDGVCDIIKALTHYGIKTNTEIQSFYRDYAAPPVMLSTNNQSAGQGMTLREPPLDKYPNGLFDRAEDFSDVAIVVISRYSYESGDIYNYQSKANGLATDNSRHYLEISTEEEEMLKEVGKRFEKTIVLLNCGQVFECSFMETIEGLDSCVFVGYTGTQAAAAIPALLWGDTSFSGKLVDTVPYDFLKDIPSSYDNWFAYNSSDGWYGYDYIEGIYVGYKWFETADHEGVYTKRTNGTKTGYEAVVQYPFGYGLSYTEFEWTVKSVSPAAGTTITENTKFSITVEVKNVGEKAGRDVVQAYVTVPYTKGGIEKSYVSLVGYAKTAELIQGASQEVTIEIDAYDFLSYDCYDKNENGFKGYELEKGEYQIKLMTDSHNVKNAFFTGKTDAEPAVIAYNVENDIKVATDRTTGAEVKNLFTGEDAVDGFSLDGSDSGVDIPWMSRADFKDGYEIPAKTDEVTNRKLTGEARNALQNTAAEMAAWDVATVDDYGNPVPTTNPTWGQNTGNYKLWEDKNGKIEATALGLTLGADYDAPEWEEVLNSITYQEALALIGAGMNASNAVGSIGKPYWRSYDSMIQTKGYAGAPRGTGNPSTTILAMNWDIKLTYEYAINYANDMVTYNVKTVYGPGVNIHRTPFCGRNMEYFSEDAFITAEIAATIIRGLHNYGCGVEIKHLILNEAETRRVGACSWVSEQALREIYLKPFYEAVVEQGANGIMSSYNRIGSEWTGASVALLDALLRKEWKFNGYVDTDWTGGEFNIDVQLRAGGDMGMSTAVSDGRNNGGFGSSLADSYNNATPRLQWRVRDAVKHILYAFTKIDYQKSVYVPEADETVVSSFTIDPWEWWRPAITAVNLAVYLGCLVWLIGFFAPSSKRMKEMSIETENTEA